MRSISVTVRFIVFASIILGFGATVATAQDDQLVRLPGAPAQTGASDDLVRLPGQGERNTSLPTPHQPKSRMKPGGGLMLSFDSNADGRVTQAELMQGVAAAFAKADSNGDGELTALEQQDWAAKLPTRDDTLANPARFDPNLDRVVQAEEFTEVIVNLAADYADESSGDIILASLETTDRPGRRDEAAKEERRRTERERRERERQRQRQRQRW